MSDAVQAAIKAAQEQSKNAVATVQPGGAVTNYQEPARKMGLDDLDSGTLDVDGFIQPKFEGLSLKMQDTDLLKGAASIFEEIVARINVGEDTAVFLGAKYGNKPTTYIKTFDGVNEARGGKWDAALAKAKLADPNVYTYKGADIKFTVHEVVKDIKGKEVLPVGTTLGHSSTPTGLKNLKKFTKAVKDAGLTDQDVIVKITNEPRSADGNNWGVLVLELVGPAPEAAE